ncbi:MAG: TrbG/VirB9 family P-type conjugative transfer protein [Alphaproteobacteria bacterium]|nr:TrbG/VirB9 family P-type conjugative transfer protein [Alphaproteobacteria bacterium]
MFKQKLHRQGWLSTAAFFVLFSVVAHSEGLPTDVESERLSDAIAQTNGDYESVNPNYLHSLGMQQKAWNDPMAHLGEGQSKPGYSKYAWSPDVILPIRIREGMMTLINLPTWELIEKVHIGSPESFGGEIAAPNSLLLYADPSYIGVDSNMIIFGRSGNRYVFYLRSETYNADKISQSVVDILVGPRYTPVENGGRLGATNGATNRAVGNGFLNSNKAPGWAMGRSGGQNPQLGINTASTGPKDWLQSIPVDPENIRFDIDIYIPNPSDVDIAPDNVWRDNIFTYIDLGPKALTMTQRPVVSLLVQDTEVPVGFRTTGPNSRLIVVEAIGDLVLRNGKKLICLKLRRDPSAGLEYTDYSGSENMTVSPYTGRPSVMSSDSPAYDPTAITNKPTETKPNIKSSLAPTPQMMGGYNQNGYTPQMGANYEQGMTYDSYAPNYLAGFEQQNNSFYTSNMAPIQSIPTNVMNSPKASAGIVGVMSQMPISTQRNSALASSETISIELGTHADITELESIWEKILEKNSDVLRGYEPYYSVDATADSNMRELFRLRVGPIKDITLADKLCKRLGRRGFGCSVVRVQ